MNTLYTRMPPHIIDWDNQRHEHEVEQGRIPLEIHIPEEPSPM